MTVPRWFRTQAIIVLLFLIPMADGQAAAPVRVKVIVDSAGIKAAPEIGGQTLANLPLGTILAVDSKQGEWYRVTTAKDGATLTGYIHELLVEEVNEGESAGGAPSRIPVVTQGETIAGIELKLAETKDLIRQDKDLDTAAEILRPLIARTFSVDDRARQKRIACEIYLWLGLAYGKKGDSYGALREFLNMFEADYATAKEVTRNIYEPGVISLIEQADKQARGLLVDYSLEITSDPKEAAVKVDGKEIGLTPEVYRTTVPQLRLEVAKEGYKTYAEDVFLSQPSTQKEVVLESVGRPVAVSSVPPGARVFVDGRDSGKTTDCELTYLPYGSHVFTLKKAGWADQESNVEIPQGTGQIDVKVMLTAVSYSPGIRLGGPGTKVFKLPKAVGFDGAGNFYVADESEIKVKKYAPDGRLQITWGDTGRELKSLKKPAGIAFDGQGNCFVTDAEAAAVFKFTKDGKLVNKWGKRGAKPGELMAPRGIAVDGSGDIYVADSGNNRVVKYSPGGVVKKTWGKPGTGRGEFMAPAGVAVTPESEVVVVDSIRVQKFSSEGEPVAVWGKAGSGDGEFNRPLGAAVDGQGYIYVADTGNGRVQKFNPQGGLTAKWGAGDQADLRMVGPSGVTVNAKGSVFVVETENGRLLEFKPQAQ